MIRNLKKRQFISPCFRSISISFTLTSIKLLFLKLKNKISHFLFQEASSSSDKNKNAGEDVSTESLLTEVSTEKKEPEPNFEILTNPARIMKVVIVIHCFPSRKGLFIEREGLSFSSYSNLVAVIA